MTQSLLSPADDFKKMYLQKFKEMEKAYKQQEKSIKAMKAHGKSRANAVSTQQRVFGTVMWCVLIRKQLLRKRRPTRRRKVVGLRHVCAT